MTNSHDIAECQPPSPVKVNGPSLPRGKRTKEHGISAVSMLRGGSVKRRTTPVIDMADVAATNPEYVVIP
jgi:hypothetical protein